MAARLLTVMVVLVTVVALSRTTGMAACVPPVHPDATVPAVRQLVVGTWYSETQAPHLGMTQQISQTFLPTGVFEYRDRTCGSLPGVPCSENYGHGVWMATRQPDGTINMRVQFSDLNRQNACTGWSASFPNPHTMVYTNGGRARRVK